MNVLQILILNSKTPALVTVMHLNVVVFRLLDLWNSIESSLKTAASC